MGVSYYHIRLNTFRSSTLLVLCGFSLLSSSTPTPSKSHLDKNPVPGRNGHSGRMGFGIRGFRENKSVGGGAEVGVEVLVGWFILY